MIYILAHLLLSLAGSVRCDTAPTLVNHSCVWVYSAMSHELPPVLPPLVLLGNKYGNQNYRILIPFSFPASSGISPVEYPGTFWGVSHLSGRRSGLLLLLFSSDYSIPLITVALTFWFCFGTKKWRNRSRRPHSSENPSTCSFWNFAQKAQRSSSR